jgi:hypothetical protein
MSGMRTNRTRPELSLHDRVSGGALDARRGQRTERMSVFRSLHGDQDQAKEEALLRRMRALQLIDAASSLPDVTHARARAGATSLLGLDSPGVFRAAHGDPGRDPIRSVLVDRPYPA